EDKDSKVYIFKEGLFTRVLLPIILNKDREMQLNCTRYALNKILYFLIENNLSFRILNSTSFQNLLSYFNSHILNIVAQDILKEFLSTNSSELELSNYINNTISLDNTNEEKEEINTSNTIIIRLRRLISLIKYTNENKQLLEEGIEKYKKEGLLPSNLNKKTIPLDNSTRWNSTYYIINTAIELQ
ncbi:hypothetical protein BGZ63DRAFT_321932, partial [Mariannaea sp. PMI_226]